MIFQIKTSVSGCFLLRTPIKTIYRGRYLVELFIEDSQYKISISKVLGEKDQLNPKLRGNLEEMAVVLPPEESYIDMINIFQIIESIGGYHYGISKIFYQEELEFQWRQGFSLDNIGKRLFGGSKTIAKEKSHFLSEKNLSSILFLHKLVPEAEIPYSFYREGSNYFQSQNYVSAYIHFFMVLEFLYAKGKFKQIEQINEFLKSEELILGIFSTVDMLLEQSSPIVEWLKNECHQRSIQYNLKGIIDLLVKFRGLLSHASPRSKSYFANPIMLRPLVIFIHSLCMSVCGYLQVYCMSNKSSKEQRINTRIEDLKNKLKGQFSI